MNNLEQYINTSEDLNDVELNKELLEKFEWLTPRNLWSGKKITDCMGENGELGFWPNDEDHHPDYDYTYTLLNDFPIGWRFAFGWEMINEINDVISECNLKDFYPTQIKEKYGSLRFYTSYTTETIYNIIKKYEDMSERICVNCGKPATKISVGWICPWCSDCAEKIHDKVVDIDEWFKKN